MEIKKLQKEKGYKNWMAGLKQKVRGSQLKAAVTVNRELLEFYWELGAEIVAKQAEADWGSKLIPQLSADLMAEFPEMKGFSLSNLKYIRQWYLFYSETNAIGQQPVGQLKNVIAQQPVAQFDRQQKQEAIRQAVVQITRIPWGHNISIISKCKDVKEALYYVQNTIEHNWSRAVLTHQIESGLYQREVKAVSNSADALPAPQSELAEQTLKDPYIFDFLSMTRDYNERELEKGLVEHIANFMLELGAGFAYMGRQFPLRVGTRDFFIDLLFYHTRLHCYVVVELKTGEFEPEHAGKLNFYIKAVDEQLRREGDQPTIGILLCKNRDKLVAEYALSDIHKPIGVSEYQLTQALPDTLKSSLPSVEEIEKELSGGGDE